MQFQTIPGQPDIVMWITEQGSGIAREGDPEWDIYQEFLAGGNTPSMLPQATMTLEQAHILVRDEAERVLENYRSTYPAVELESWPQQVAESAAWLADPATSTPLLTAILQPDEDLQALCEKVLLRATAYRQTVADVIRWRRSASQTITTQFEQGTVTSLSIQYPEAPHAS